MLLQSCPSMLAYATPVCLNSCGHGTADLCQVPCAPVPKGSVCATMSVRQSAQVEVPRTSRSSCLRLWSARTACAGSRGADWGWKCRTQPSCRTTAAASAHRDARTDSGCKYQDAQQVEVLVLPSKRAPCPLTACVCCGVQWVGCGGHL
jgi:hypothetical protein